MRISAATFGIVAPLVDALDALVAWLCRRSGFSEQFFRFAMVGTFGFCVDTTTVYGLRHLTGIYLAGICGFLVAASANWALHRLWTFRHHVHELMHRQWGKFLLANSAGFVFNRGTFFVLVAVSPLCHRQPVFAIMAGSGAGLILNYWLSKKYVFR